jgi:hypothetical protein
MPTVDRRHFVRHNDPPVISSPHARAALVILVIVLACPAALAGAKWEVISRADDIVVSKKDVPELALPIIRGVTTFDENFYDVLAVLSDTDHYAEWMHSCLEARLLRSDGDFDLLVYNRISTPWPLEDRDTVVHTRIQINQKKKFVVIRFSNVASDLQGPVDGVTRVPMLRGFYKLEMLGPEKTRVTYQAQADPGGLIPKWLAARESRDIPNLTLSSLRSRVKQTRGTYAEFRRRWMPEHGGRGF